MASDHKAHLDRALALQDELFSEIYATAAGLTESDWQRSTNCPGWVVRDIVSHIARSAGTFAAMTDSGLRGERTFAMTQDDRERLEREFAQLSTPQLLRRLGEAHRQLRSRLASLREEELEVACPHTRGPQPAWWFGDQRLSELTFHGWDLYHSLGREREVRATVGQHLLPTLLERNVPTWHRTEESGAPRFLVRATDLENGSWQIVPSAPGAQVSRGASDGDLMVQGPSAPLIRWLYGRADLVQMEGNGTASIFGDRGLLAQWKTLFPAP